ncbi:MAG: hypothetical protein ACE5IR_16085 [bacterium]
MRTANPLNRITVRDVVVDFFGSLVPGIVFTSIAFVLFIAILFSCIAIAFLLTEHSNFQLNIASATQQLHTLISAFRIESLVFFTFLSYVFGHNLNYLIPFILCALITFMMYRIRVTIENFFHYQRVCEIVYVLETAHVASRLDSKIFEDIFPNPQKSSE